LGNIKLFLAVDYANSLYGKTTYKKVDATIVEPHEISLVYNFRKFLRNDWTNGVCVLVADKAEISTPEDRLTIPLNTPLELFGEQGFEAIDPFIPLETKNYTQSEIDKIYEYFKEKQWLTSEKARSEEGRKQLKYLSAFNPYYFDRMCSFL